MDRLFFENIRCLRCDHALAYLPDVRDLGSLDSAGQELWRSPVGMGGRTYRLCENYSRENVCNWAVAAEDPNPLCRSCRLTRVIPDLMKGSNKEVWYRLEVAKRRLVYGLLTAGLPVESKVDDRERGLAFDLLHGRCGFAEDRLSTPGNQLAQEALISRLIRAEVSAAIRDAV